MNNNFHMIDYIRESGPALECTLETNEGGVLQAVELMRERGIERLILTGVGSSFTAAMMAYPLMRIHAPIPVHAIPSTELSYYFDSLINEKAAVVSISRSGERGWVVDGLKASIAQGALGIAMTGVPDSFMAQSADLRWITQEGQEASFPKTKSVITCSGLAMRLALSLADPSDRIAKERLKALQKMPEMIANTVRSLDKPVQDAVPFIQEHSTFVITGTGANYGTALEAAIKLQETTCITSLSDDTGNFFHGPLMPLDPSWLIIPLVHTSDYKLCTEFMDLVRGIGAHTLAVAEPSFDLSAHSDYILALPAKVDQMLVPLVYLPVIQLINYYVTVASGKNPDRPEASGAILNAILPPGRTEPDF